MVKTIIVVVIGVLILSFSTIGCATHEINLIDSGKVMLKPESELPPELRFEVHQVNGKAHFVAFAARHPRHGILSLRVLADDGSVLQMHQLAIVDPVNQAKGRRISRGSSYSKSFVVSLGELPESPVKIAVSFAPDDKR